MNSGLRLALLLALVTGPHAAQAVEGAPATVASTAPLLPAGSWTGTNQLWLRDPHHPFSSAATATVTATAAGTELRYTWSYEGAPQSGVMVLTETGGAVHVTWADDADVQHPSQWKGADRGRAGDDDGGVTGLSAEGRPPAYPPPEDATGDASAIT